jgi:uncharacterized protein (TIGR02118 family)
MIKVSVLYGNTAGATFDIAYYVTRHMPMVREKLGSALKGMQVDHGTSGVEPGSAPAFLAFGHLVFDSVDAFQAAFGPHAETILGDISNYTNIQPTIQISEVKMS